METKKIIQKTTEPLAEIGKSWFGRTLYGKAFKQTGLRGALSRELASLLKNKGWYK